MTAGPGLPVGEALPALREALRTRGGAVLQAPPGAGKSTVVPLALLDEPWLAGRRLLMLEPRRLAARAVATRMAATLGEAVGGTVGYRMRLDTRVSRATRIEVLTEGVLTRMLQQDPALEGVGAVLFDEFHERSLQADLGLALVLDARATVAPELRLLVMSATLDGAAVAALLGDVPVVSAPGRIHAVETRYAGAGLPLLPGDAARGAPGPERLVAQLVSRALGENDGDVLVFLPGAREIRRVQGLLEEAPEATDAEILPLYGDLPAAAQDAALAPAATGTRKVVLATNIAETSLTLPGVRAVIDSGLVRRACFDPATGMGRLETQRISRASADQRQGRAGRTAPGVCYRAWSAGAHATLAAQTPPEIASADLAPLALDLALWGTREARELGWLDEPPAAMLASARDLLGRLGALGSDERVTPHGRAMARLGVHPRLAHMLLRARELGAVPLAARLAALIGERDLLRGGGAQDADIRTRLELLERVHGARSVEDGVRARVRRAAAALERAVHAAGRPGSHAAGEGADDGRADAGVLLGFAYPDRIARRRGGGEGRYALANGRGAAFTGPQSLARREFIVAVDLDDRERDARILLAAPLEPEALERHFTDLIVTRDVVEWSAREEAVLARRVTMLDELVLGDRPLSPVPEDEARRAMLVGVRALGIGAFPWARAARDLQARILFVRRTIGDAPDERAAWPDVSDEGLLARLEDWLPQWLDGVTRREHLAALPLADALRAQLTPAQQRELDRAAPAQLELPSGQRLRVDYLDAHAPAVSARLQDVYGLAETPRLGRARVPVTFRLLSPAQRPVQVTRDLAGFWRGSYAEVRREMRGRYPKHYWPDNPLEAEPTRRPPRTGGGGRSR